MFMGSFRIFWLYVWALCGVCLGFVWGLSREFLGFVWEWPRVCLGFLAGFWKDCLGSSWVCLGFLGQLWLGVFRCRFRLCWRSTRACLGYVLELFKVRLRVSRVKNGWRICRIFEDVLQASWCFLSVLLTFSDLGNSWDGNGWHRWAGLNPSIANTLDPAPLAVWVPDTSRHTMYWNEIETLRRRHPYPMFRAHNSKT